jgi:hypothetical protein
MTTILMMNVTRGLAYSTRIGTMVGTKSLCSIVTRHPSKSGLLEIVTQGQISVALLCADYN